MTALLVALGAAVGAPLRYLLDTAVKARRPSVFPWGTWVVNLAGSFVLGGVVALTPLSGPGFAALLVEFRVHEHHVGHEAKLLEARSSGAAAAGRRLVLCGGGGRLRRRCWSETS